MAGFTGATGATGPTGSTGFTYYLPCCKQHPINNYHFEILNHLEVDGLEAYFAVWKNLPCYVLDKVGNDQYLIDCAKRLGADCCDEKRSNLARKLLGIPLIEKHHSILDKQNTIFDDAIQLGNIEWIKTLIFANEAQFNQMDRYEDDFVVQDFLIVVICDNYEQILNVLFPSCIIQMILQYMKPSWIEAKINFISKA